VRTLRTLLATACLAATLAGAGLAQDREDRGRPPSPPQGMGRGDFEAPPYSRAGGRAYEPPRSSPPAYGRGDVMYGAPRSGPPTYGRGGGLSYPAQRFAPPPGYGPYPSTGSAPAFGGQWRDQQEFLRQGVRQGQLAPLGRVIGSIRQRTPGRQLDAGLEYQGPRLVYRVRWMTEQGRRVDYIIDAETGAIVSGR
jgi:hypothetical protein